MLKFVALIKASLKRRRFEKLIRLYEDKAQHGLGADEALAQLRGQGVHIMDAIKVLLRVYGLSLREAKERVSAHPAWRDEVEAQDRFREELIRVLTTDEADNGSDNKD